MTVRVGSSKVVLEPQILLKKQATSNDIFRSLVVVHKLLSRCRKLASASNSLGSATSDTSLVDVSAHSLSRWSDVLSDTALLRLLDEVILEEQEEHSILMQVLQEAGWSDEKYVFGDIKARVEWKAAS